MVTTQISTLRLLLGLIAFYFCLGDCGVSYRAWCLHPSPSTHCSDQCPALRGYLTGGHEERTDGESGQGKREEGRRKREREGERREERGGRERITCMLQ